MVWAYETTIIVCPMAYSNTYVIFEYYMRYTYYNPEWVETDDPVRVGARRENWTLEAFVASLSTQGAPCKRVVACVVHKCDSSELEELRSRFTWLFE